MSRGLVSGANPRFHRVFNKLRAWELDRYAKVCLLDTDTLVVRNADELLSLPTPTALVRGRELPLPGQMPGEHKGINAGVIVLSPHSNGPGGFQDMKRQLEQDAANGVRYGTAPEQNFLSRHLEWQESLHWKYNFQLHQLMFSANEGKGRGKAYQSHIKDGNSFRDEGMGNRGTGRGIKCYGADGAAGTENCRNSKIVSRMHIVFDEVVIFHYSTVWKPSRFLCSKGFEGKGWDEFMGAFFKQFGCKHAGARVLIDKAFRKWYDYWQEMWQYLLQQIAERSSNVTDAHCLLCEARRFDTWQANAEHAFVRCAHPQVREAVDEWRQELQLPQASFQTLLQLRRGISSFAFNCTSV